MNPHLFCKPVIQGAEDRRCLQEMAVSGNPKFFFGSDSAPHLRAKKECGFGAAGIYSAPVLLPALVGFFMEHGALDRLESFVSVYGADFYGLPLNCGELVLESSDWVVPLEMDGVVPLLAGETLHWRIKC